MKSKDPNAVKLGSKGGKARRASLSPERRSAIAKDAALKMWEKHPERRKK